MLTFDTYFNKYLNSQIFGIRIVMVRIRMWVAFKCQTFECVLELHLWLLTSYVILSISSVTCQWCCPGFEALSTPGLTCQWCCLVVLSCIMSCLHQVWPVSGVVLCLRHYLHQVWPVVLYHVLSTPGLTCQWCCLVSYPVYTRSDLSVVLSCFMSCLPVVLSCISDTIYNRLWLREWARRLCWTFFSSTGPGWTHNRKETTGDHSHQTCSLLACQVLNWSEE